MDYAVADYRPATIECVLASAVKRDVPANVLLAIAQIEGGKEGLVKTNANGSYDFGRWQINSVHVEEMAEYGVSPEVFRYYVLHDGCYGADFAAYRLQRCFNNPKWANRDVWEKAACYHSKTPSKNAIYRAKLKPPARAWADWLEANYPVTIKAVTAKGMQP